MKLAPKFIVSTSVVLLAVFSMTIAINKNLTEKTLEDTLYESGRVIGALTLNQEDADQYHVRDKSDRIAQLFANIAPQLIADLDLTTLKRFTEVASNDPDIEYVEFLDAQGQSVVSAGTITSPEFLVNLPIQTDGTNFGTVRIGYTLERSDDRQAAIATENGERYDAIVAANDVALRNLVSFSILTSVIAAFLIGVACTLLIRFYVRRPLDRIVHAAEQLADGDLRTRVQHSGNDEISVLADAFNRMSSRFSELIAHVHASSHQLATTSTEVVAITETAQEGVHTQHREVELVVGAMQEMTSTVRDVALGASEASEFARHIASEAEKGKNVIGKTVDTINDVSSHVDRSTAAVQQLGAHSQTIGSIVDVIKSIAEQTNLLALNASIEAARAGEQGRGFAVVADEVRTLARRTQQSTAEIESMISKLQDDASQVVSAMEGSQAQVNRSVDQTRAAGDVLETILNEIRRISEVNDRIASATDEQLSVVEELNRNMASISNVADDSAQGINHTLKATENLEQTAQALASMVEKFKVA